MTCIRSLLRSTLPAVLALFGCFLPTLLQAAEHLDPVVLQLKWKHAFQFAGYYAALEQGYYRDAGLDVTLLELSGDTSPASELLAGKANYAVTGSDIVIHRANGEPIVALATIFQHSPYAFLVRADSGLTKVEDFVGKRVMIGSGAQGADLKATLRRAGLAENDYRSLPTNYDARSLSRGEVDVFDAYVTDQAQTLEEEGVQSRYILPNHYGVDFYGDVLATTESEIKQHPKRVQAFREASLKGWSYALNHADELIELILAKYNTQGVSKAHLQYEALATREMIQPLLVNIGYMNPERWQHIQTIFADGGFISKNAGIEGLTYEERPPEPNWIRWIADHTFPIGIGLALFLALGLLLVLEQLRRVVRHRTAALTASENYLRAVIDATPLCVRTMDKYGNLLTMNPAGLAMLKAANIEILRKFDITNELIDPEYRSGMQELVRKVFAGTSGSLLFSIRDLQGSRLWLQTFAVPLCDAGGEVSGMLGVTIDVTNQKHMEAVLQEQNAKLQNLLDNINGISWELDLGTGKFTYVSPNSPRILGYTNDEWVDIESWTNMIVPEDREYARLQREAETAAGNDHIFEYRMHKKGGEVIWVLDVVRVIKDSNGNPLRMAGFILNQSEVKQAEAALQESEQRYRTIFEGAPEGVWLIDDEFRTLQVNQRLCSLLDYSREEMDGRLLTDFLAAPGMASITLPAGTGSIRHEFEVELRHRDGHHIPAFFSFARLPTRHDVKTATVAFVTDLSGKKQAENALRRAQKMEAVGQLTGGIAHDFNNILAIIQGNLELLETQLGNREQIQARVDSLKTVTTRAINLTQQLLGFSRTQPDHSVLCNLNELIESTHILIERSHTADIAVHYQLAAGLWQTRIDPGDFQDSLINLCINARDAISGSGSIIISTANVSQDSSYCAKHANLNEGDYVRFSVRDSGTGIKAQHMDHIFEPFFTTKANGKGTGLGLSMVFGFVQRSAGHIEVKSDPGDGATFHLYLPRAASDNQGIANSVQTMPCTTAGLEKILVVDDETGLLELAEQRLGHLGYQVVTAADGATALAILTKHQDIALLFTDVVMPGELNGYELAEQAMRLNPLLKILHTSGYTEHALAEAYNSRFVADLLKKPYSLNELAVRVRMALDKPGPQTAPAVGTPASDLPGRH